ncbi:hypothetical protein M407DRAFT_244848 [Tulasnella calospora MUT 4182]|uniref:Uncharacterized protein n=1 Tax=Tulasnella calospora MUT 4182 TaxID=1051891 RepID=A0A0C3QCU2_9AGAM|nr:hypothetical protein M407DRAFT_244848 [Tulasnella calospora MUT 4182]
MFSASRQAWLDGAKSVTLAYFADDPFRNDSTTNSLETEEFDDEDDTDVSQAALVASITVLATGAKTDLSVHGVHMIDGRVESDDNIPVYDMHGESMGISSAGLIEVPAVPEHAPMEELGRGKRRRIPNPQYSGSFWVAH